MALDCGPERMVRAPGDRAREESRDVANVSVVNGISGRGVEPSFGGSWHSKNPLSDSGNSSASRVEAIVEIFSRFGSFVWLELVESKCDRRRFPIAA